MPVLKLYSEWDFDQYLFQARKLSNQNVMVVSSSFNYLYNMDKKGVKCCSKPNPNEVMISHETGKTVLIPVDTWSF